MPGIAELFPNLNIKGIRKAKTDFMVIVSNGYKGKSYPITEIIGYNEGYALRYKDSENKLDTVYIPREFKFLEINNKYYLGKRLGNDSGCEIDYEDTKIKEGVEVIGPSVDPECPGEDLSSLIRTDVMAIGYSTLTESKVPRKWIVILIIVAIVAAAIYFFMRSKGG